PPQPPRALAWFRSWDARSQSCNSLAPARPGTGRLSSPRPGLELAPRVPMQSFLQDLRYGLRMLVRSPASSAVAIVALALGIGPNTAIFSLVETVLLRPLPYHQPDRLVQVWEDASAIGFPRNTPAPGNYADWKAQNQVFDDMSAGREATYTMTGAGEP